MNARLLLTNFIIISLFIASGVTYAQHDDGEKVAQLMKAHMAFSTGQHEKFHQMLEVLTRKYPSDQDMKGLFRYVHEAMHQRMAVSEDIVRFKLWRILGK